MSPIPYPAAWSIRWYPGRQLAHSSQKSRWSGEILPRVRPSHACAAVALAWTAITAGALAAQEFHLSRFARFEVGSAGTGIDPGPAARAAIPENAVTEPRQKRFWPAAGEVVLLEVVPWAFDRYVLKEDFAYISFDTIKQNFKTGFKYDSDHFLTNQSSHPYHGGLFFTAARSNGYGYWESGLFALAGSLMWECCMENTAPSINDLVNTTLGGMTRGEVAHRLSIVVLDNTATGADRVWREIVATLLNPVGAFNRLVRGEMFSQGANPPDRFPRDSAFRRTSAIAGSRGPPPIRTRRCSRFPPSTAIPSRATSRTRSTRSTSAWTSISREEL